MPHAPSPLSELDCQASAVWWSLHLLDDLQDLTEAEYLDLVNRMGDPVSQEANERAMLYLGIDCEFFTRAKPDHLSDLLRRGHTVPIAIFHDGDASCPTGGGRWVTITGEDPYSYSVYDPSGLLDLVRGGYTWQHLYGSRNYDKTLLRKRWLVDGEGWCWWIKNDTRI